jgi:hypothetical protein
MVFTSEKKAELRAEKALREGRTTFQPRGEVNKAAFKALKLELEKTTNHINSHTSRVIGNVSSEISTMKKMLTDHLGPEWNDNWTPAQKKTFFQNRRADDLNRMRNIGIEIKEEAAKVKANRAEAKAKARTTKAKAKAKSTAQAVPSREEENILSPPPKRQCTEIPAPSPGSNEDEPESNSGSNSDSSSSSKSDSAEKDEANSNSDSSSSESASNEDVENGALINELIDMV